MFIHVRGAVQEDHVGLHVHSLVSGIPADVLLTPLSGSLTGILAVH